MEAAKKHSLETFILQLTQALKEQADPFIKGNTYGIENITACLQAARRVMAQLNEFITGHTFADTAEEIAFYKQHRPTLLSHKLFYQQLLDIELATPLGDSVEKESFYRKQLQALDDFRKGNQFMYKYLKSGSSLLDEKLFCRPTEETIIALYILDLAPGNDLSCSCDYLVACIKANAMLENELLNIISRLHAPVILLSPVPPDPDELVWTGSKRDLIELGYAFQKRGCFNNGNATTKQVMGWIEKKFNTVLGNTSRSLQEILSRKSGYKSFPQQLVDALTDFFDHLLDKDRR